MKSLGNIIFLSFCRCYPVKHVLIHSLTIPYMNVTYFDHTHSLLPSFSPLSYHPLSLIRVAFMSMSEGLFTAAQATCQWLHYRRKMAPFPQQPSTANSSSFRGGTLQAPLHPCWNFDCLNLVQALCK